MSLAVLGQATIITGSTGDVGTRYHFAPLADGRYVISGPDNASSETVFIRSADGTPLRGIALSTIGGLPGLDSAQNITVLPDGRFIVSGLIQGTLDVGYVVFEADGTPVGYDDTGSTRFTRPVFDAESFGGALRSAHEVKALPDGRLVFAWTSVKDLTSGSVGTIGSVDIEGAGNSGTTSADVRIVIVDADGTVGPEIIATQGQVTFPTYEIDSRFGAQSLRDLDILPDGSIVPTYVGVRFGPPETSLGQTVSNPFAYASLRVLDDTGASLAGETPMADGAIGTATADNFGINEALGQTIELSDGRLAGFFGRLSTATAYQISVRFFTADGVPVGSATPLDFVIDRALGRAVVMAALPTTDGGFVVLHNGDDGLPEPLRNETHLYLARYNGDGSLVERVRVTDTAALWDIRSFEIAPDGDFLAAITPNSTDLQLARLVLAGSGELVLTGGVSSDRQTLGSLNDWYDGGDGGDTAFGRAGNDRLYGRAGNDRLYGDLGSDLLDGGDGADTLVGGAGNDTFRGGAGNDVIQAGAGGDNRVDLSGGGNNRVLLGAGADTVIGGTGDDVILGGRGGNNRIDLSAGGNNRVNAGDGADTIIGGAGRDVIRPGRGDDLVDLRAGGDNFVFNLRGNSTILGGAGDDVIFGGIGDTRILAGGGDNRIVAGPGRDTIGFVQEAHETRLLDFRPGSDVMDFTGHDGVSGLGDLAIAQLGSSLVITDGSGGRIVLAGVALDQIDDSAFIF